MTDPKHGGRQHSVFKSLRFRVIAGLVGLAVIPFSIAIYLLFEVVRTNIQYRTGERLASNARLIAGEIERDLAAYENLCKRLADAPYTGSDYVAELKMLAGDILLDAGTTRGKPEEKTWVEMGDDGHLTCLVPVKGGNFRARFSGQNILKHVTNYNTGFNETAYLIVGKKITASSRPSVTPIPDAITYSTAWFEFSFGEKDYYGAAVKIKGQAGAAADAAVLLMTPEDVFLVDYEYMLSRSAIIIGALLGVLLVLSWKMTGNLCRPIEEIRLGSEIISRINLTHRIKVKTGDELEYLADDFNHMAQSLQTAYVDLEKRVFEVAGDLYDEKRRLSTILRTMAEGVVVANEKGEMILLNPRARAALIDGPQSGVGMPLSRVLPGERLKFHMDQLISARQKGRDEAQSVIFELPNGKILRGLMTVMEDQSSFPGFLLIFKDITEEADHEEQSQRLLATLPAEVKGPVSTLKTMLEILDRRKDLDHVKQRPFIVAMKEEAEKTARTIELAENAIPRVRYLRWPIQPADTRELLERAAGVAPAIPVTITVEAETLPPVAIEPFSWSKILRALIVWAKGGSGPAPLHMTIGVEDDFVIIGCEIKGSEDKNPDELNHLHIAVEGERDLTMSQALAINRADLWTRKTGDGYQVRLGISKASAIVEIQTVSDGDSGRPEFYDFDLFLPKPSVESDQSLNMPLNELEYVVFDTESTGLEISKGAKIVSISGVRVRGGKVVLADTFDALVNPGMPIPPSSTAVHGINDGMVANAPGFSEILPHFIDWIGDSILVAHNAAFDTKLIAAEAASCGMKSPSNTVLDTLLLSYGIHKGAEGHSLDAICDRLGVSPEARHTSIGDAVTTARIFAKFLPLLNSRGIFSLAQAKAFCDRMLLLRWQSSRY